MSLEPRYKLHRNHTLVAHVGPWDLSRERHSGYDDDWSVDGSTQRTYVRMYRMDPIKRPVTMTDEDYATMVAIINLLEGP